MRVPPPSTPFPYTTLFRSNEDELVLPSVTFSNFAVVGDGVYFIPAVDSDGRWTVHYLSFRTWRSSPILRLTGHVRSEEHTSELQSQFHLVCRLLLETNTAT